MGICYAFGCNHQSMRRTCKFFRFPKDKKQLAIWTDLCRRSDSAPNDYSKLCSCHFVDGKKENGPTIFPWNKKTAFHFKSPEKKRRRRRNFSSETAEAEEERTASCSETAEAEEESTASCSETAEAEEERTAVDVVEEAGTALDSMREGTGVAEGETSLSDINEEHADAQLTAELPNTENLFSYVCSLEGQVSALQSELALLKLQKSNTAGNTLNFRSVSANFEIFHYYTGLPSVAVFNMLVKWLSSQTFEYVDSWRPQMPLEDQLLLTLLKLRINSDYTDLAVRFQVSRRSIRNIFVTVLLLLHRYLFPLIQMPSLEKNREVLPPAFYNFNNCRCVVDCTEIQCVVPRSSLDQQSQTFSYYKSKNTFKGLVACSPNGAITFISNLYPGSASDKYIFRNCGIINLLREGDMVLADKGFLISDLLPQGVTVNIPPFLKGHQLTECEAKVTTEIARARIIIERVIGRMKSYNILDSFPTNLRDLADVIFQVVGCLVNFHDLITPETAGEEEGD